MLTEVNTAVFRADEAKRQLIGLARDLRGVAFAFNTKVSYMMLFEWMYPCSCKIIKVKALHFIGDTIVK